METHDTIAIIVALATLVSAVGGMVLGILNRSNIHTIHLAINSRLDQLLMTTKLSSFAEGEKQERDRGQILPKE